MSATFKIKNTLKTIDIKGENEEVLKTFSLDVGNYEQMEKWTAEIEKVEAISKKLAEDSNGAGLTDLKALEESIITMILGADSWAWIWEAYNHNIMGCLAFVRFLQDFVNTELIEFQKGYV